MSLTTSLGLLALVVTSTSAWAGRFEDPHVRAGLSMSHRPPGSYDDHFGLAGWVDTVLFGGGASFVGPVFEARAMGNLVEGYDAGFGGGIGVGGERGVLGAMVGVGADRMGWRDEGVRKAGYAYGGVRLAYLTESRIGLGGNASFHARTAQSASQEVRTGAWVGFVNLRWGFERRRYWQDTLSGYPPIWADSFFWMGFGLPSATWSGR